MTPERLALGRRLAENAQAVHGCNTDSERPTAVFPPLARSDTATADPPATLRVLLFVPILRMLACLIAAAWVCSRQ